MDSLTSFLLNEQGELSLDAFTDSMLANLPQQAEGVCSLDPIVPFQTPANKAPDFGAPIEKLPQGAAFSGPEPWDALMLAPQATDVAAPLYTQPLQMPMPPQSLPTGSPYTQQDPLPQSAALMPQMQEKSSSPRSSEGRDDPDYAKLQERIQKQKEKNARNQRQFRKRAKEKANKVEEQLQELTSKLAAMETEKHSLAARNKILETALATARTMPGRGNSSLATVMAELSDPRMSETLEPVVLHVREGQLLQLSVQEIQKMTWLELARLWKEYVNGLAMALVHCSTGQSEQASPRLVALVEDVATLMKSVALHNALLLHQHSCRRMDSTMASAQDQLPSRGFYNGILSQLGLTAEQREQILAHRHIKLVSLARLVQERRELQVKLQAVNDAAANPLMESAPCIGMGAEYPQLLEVTERLNENVAQLHRSVCLFMGQAWNKVLTPVQAATFMVQAFPYPPDMLALANAIADEAKAPPVQQIFNEVLRAPPADTPLLGF